MTEPTPKSYIVVSEKSAWIVCASIALLVLAVSLWQVAELRWAFDRGYSLGVVTEDNHKVELGELK